MHSLATSVRTPTPFRPRCLCRQVHHAEDGVWLDMVSAEDDDMNAWCMAGYKLVARGQAAVLLVAGIVRGQAAYFARFSRPSFLLGPRFVRLDLHSLSVIPPP